MNFKKIVVLTLFLGAVGLGVFSYKIYSTLFVPNTKFLSKNEEIFIKTGASFEEMLETLRPFLKDEASFKAAAEQKGYHQNIKAGRYILKNGMNNNDIITLLRIGNTPVKVSFNNQERLENLAGRIAEQIEADSLSLLEAFTDATFLEKNDLTIENALSIFIPNTYELYWNTSAEQFRARMLKEYHKFWNQKRLQKAENQKLTPLQVIALASIVQKETTKIQERPRVAGLYLNRLHSGWKLEADPTLIYAFKQQSGNYDTIIKRVYNKYKEIDSPYNTYRYEGIPPGPIAMPDISAIEAVLQPEKHDFYFMVADTEKLGFHIFSKDLRQHNAYSKKYHDWANQQKIK